MIYLDARLSHARGKSTGMPELRNRVMKRIMRKVEYSLYGLNWNEVISAFMCFCKILPYLFTRVEWLAWYFDTRNISHTPIMSNRM